MSDGITVQESASPVLALIERAARDPQVDIDKVERLFQLYERRLELEQIALETERRQEAERAFEEAFAAAQAKMPRVGKNALNPQTRSRYATLDAVLAAIVPALTQERLSLSFSRRSGAQEGTIVVSARVAGFGHSREWERSVPVMTTGMAGKVNMTITHADASAETYGKRYLANSIFALAIGEEDDDGNEAGRLPMPPQAEPSAVDSKQRDPSAERFFSETVASLAKFESSIACKEWWNSETERAARQSILDRQDQLRLLDIARETIDKLSRKEKSNAPA